MTEPGAQDLEDIQGLIYSGWNDHPHAGFVFASLAGGPAASRGWLDAVRGEVTPAARPRRRHHGRIQVALSVSGLRALGVPGDVIEMLPPEAQLGMAARQRTLNDNDPAGWQLGRPDQPIDALILVYARDAGTLRQLIDDQLRALRDAGARALDPEIAWPMGQREHFGFADGLSQPHLPGLHAAPRPGEDPVAAGEILLGYPNAYGRMPITPIWDEFDLGRNGSYLVFRKLQQDVPALWGWIADHARQLSDGNASEAARLTELLGAKLVGRWRSGAPLTLTPDHDDLAYATPDRLNAFKYLAHDADGMRCPISAHIRRANPRDARGGSARDSETVISRHRILRRGRSYGQPMPYERAITGRDDGVARGLYFLCLQSSIARGFEFIQQTWLANPGFLGLHNEPDPIVGGSDDGHFTIPAEPTRLRLGNVPSVVTNLGGGYFFLPSLAALARIAAGP
jgi:Dyp-type peroxidase family